MSEMPWQTDEDLERDDALRAARSYEEQLDMEVAREVRHLKVREMARARIQAEKAAHVDYGAQYLDRAGLLDLPTPEALIDRVLPRHAYGLLRGRDGTLKSFVALDWAWCLATGKPWQGHPVDPVRVLYIAGEGAHGLRARVDAWEYAWGHNVPPGMFSIRTSALNLHQPGPAFDHLLDYVHTGGYGLVVVDTLRRVAGAADGNSSEMGLVIDNLDRIKQATHDGTVLAVAHTDKGDNDTRGYSGIEDDADFVWAAKRDDMFLTLELTKMKDGPDGATLQLEATRTLSSLTLTGTSGPAEVNTTESQLKILDALRIMPEGGVTGPDLMATAVLGKPTFYRALTDLKTSGQIVATKTGRTTYYELPGLTFDAPTDTTPHTAEDTTDTPLDQEDQ